MSGKRVRIKLKDAEELTAEGFSNPYGLLDPLRSRGDFDAILYNHWSPFGTDAGDIGPILNIGDGWMTPKLFDIDEGAYDDNPHDVLTKRF